MSNVVRIQPSRRDNKEVRDACQSAISLTLDGDCLIVSAPSARIPLAGEQTDLFLHHMLVGRYYDPVVFETGRYVIETTWQDLGMQQRAEDRIFVLRIEDKIEMTNKHWMFAPATVGGAGLRLMALRRATKAN